MPETHIRFTTRIGAQKPETIVNRKNACPFCNRSDLTNIIAEDGPILWLKNKYPVLQSAFQTVIIETEECETDLSEYSLPHLTRVLRFGLHHWQHMVASGEYESVLFFKNHGPWSGGTIRHPHMQIVGLDAVDYHENLDDVDFEGIPIYEAQGVSLNLSTRPRVGFFEFNILFDYAEADTTARETADTIPELARVLHATVHYVMNHFNRKSSSYNLFFYDRGVEQRGHRFVAKVIPRFVTSPLFIGYGIPQVSDRVEEVAHDLRRRYFERLSEKG